MEKDSVTGRKFINNYEVIEEIGRGVHGKVKLARTTDSHENVAIKIIPRFSKTRRLGKVTAKSPVNKTKCEIAILKKVRHPNVVALLEVIDDPELKKIYMVLEHVELGEVVWRRKGIPRIFHFERRRVEREIRGEVPTEEEMHYMELLQKRQAVKDIKLTHMTFQTQSDHLDHWSFESGAAIDDDTDGELLSNSALSHSASASGSHPASGTPSRVHSLRAMSRNGTPQPIEIIAERAAMNLSPCSSAIAPEGTMMYGAYTEDPKSRTRSPSMADSIVSHMSSVDFNPQAEDPFADEYSYVPCFTLEQARTTFRDTVLGLEYLHYQGIIHRDIKPANLLWTKDHHVKISDFGVSYFGRPIRDGEPDDLVSESEAHDFDDELELAKTVGTPAFFAPELCYADLDAKPPKISEQMDVWSLGVTLYCLIFARLPFLAEDEWQMFKKIATEEVHISRHRLRPVDPCSSPSTTPLDHPCQNKSPYRDDSDLAYEDIDDLLHDLLRRMLIKDPEKRIRLQEVKRHPWVVEGISQSELLKWIDETDPRMQAQGQKIQVDEGEMKVAVVPLTLMERTKSLFKKWIHGRPEGSSRRRATSSVASSAGDSPQAPAPALAPGLHGKDLRRRSIKPDDYLASPKEFHQPLDHRLTHGVATDLRSTPVVPSTQAPEPVGVPPRRPPGLDVTNHHNMRSDTAERATQTSTSTTKSFQRHGYAKSITNALLSFTPGFSDGNPSPGSPTSENTNTCAMDTFRRPRDIRAVEGFARARSVDRGFFNSSSSSSSNNTTRVEYCPASATGPTLGNAHPRRPRPARSTDLGKVNAAPLPLASPLSFSPRALSSSQGHPRSDPNMREGQDGYKSQSKTSHRIQDIPEGQIMSSGLHHVYSPIGFYSRVPDASFHAVHRDECGERVKSSHMNLRRGTCPAITGLPSEHEVVLDACSPPARQNVSATIKSSSSNSIGAMTSPRISPTTTTNPTTGQTKHQTDSMLNFKSDTSLPALLSGASSISADAEGEFLAMPGKVDRSLLIQSPDSLTPPAIVEETSTGFPVDRIEDQQNLGMPIDSQSLRRSVMSPKLPQTAAASHDSDGESETDEGFLMMGKGRKAQLKNTFRACDSRHRDTNASIGSTDTAKKVSSDVGWARRHS